MLRKLPQPVFRTFKLIALVALAYVLWLLAGYTGSVLDSVADMTDKMVYAFARFMPEPGQFDPVVPSIHYVAWAQAAMGATAAYLKYRYFNQPDNQTRYLFNEVFTTWATASVAFLLLPVLGVICVLAELRTVLFSMFLTILALLLLKHIAPAATQGRNQKVMHCYMYLCCAVAVLSFCALLLVQTHKYPVFGMAEVLVSAVLGLLFARVHLYIHADQVANGEFTEHDSVK